VKGSEVKILGNCIYYHLFIVMYIGSVQYVVSLLRICFSLLFFNFLTYVFNILFILVFYFVYPVFLYCFVYCFSVCI
jgi:hypothetical protein